MKKNVVLGAWVLSLILGCSGKSSTSSSPTPPAGPAVTLVEKQALEGVWFTACVQDAQTGKYVRNQIGIFLDQPQFGDEVLFQRVFFETSACDVSIADQSLFATMTLLQEAKGQGQKIDLVVEYQSITPKNQDVTNAFNRFQVCGKNDYQVDSEESLSGLTCNADLIDLGPIYTIGQSARTILTLKGQQLFIGNLDHVNDGTTEAKRPTTLSALPFEKINN